MTVNKILRKKTRKKTEIMTSKTISALLYKIILINLLKCLNKHQFYNLFSKGTFSFNSINCIKINLALAKYLPHEQKEESKN